MEHKKLTPKERARLEEILRNAKSEQEKKS